MRTISDEGENGLGYAYVRLVEPDCWNARKIFQAEPKRWVSLSMVLARPSPVPTYTVSASTATENTAGDVMAWRFSGSDMYDTLVKLSPPSGVRKTPSSVAMYATVSLNAKSYALIPTRRFFHVSPPSSV